MTVHERVSIADRHRERTTGGRARAAAIWVVAIITATIALSLGSRFFVPLTLGVILAAILHPIVAALRRIHIPQALAAAVATLFALVILVLAVVLLNAPVRTLRAEIPKTLMTARSRLEALGKQVRGPDSPDRAARPARAAPPPTTGARDSATDSSQQRSKTTAPARTDTSTASQQGGGGAPTSGIGATIARAFGVTVAILFALVEILLLAFFILAAGNAWREKLRETSGSPEREERALDTIVEIRRAVLRYLFVNVVINAAQGVLVAAVVWPLGYPFPVLWGVLTFIAEFIPYFGGAAMVALLFLTGLAEAHGFTQGAIAPIAYLIITTLQNNLVSPPAYGRSLRLNPTAILAGVMFWGLVWGVAGAFLAVPLLAAARIFAERNDALRWLAVVLTD